MKSDKYASLAALAADLREGVDFRVEVKDRKSWLTVVAPHGGHIESGSSALAAALTVNEYNLFDFQGLRSDSAQDLHVTSTRFRHPVLDKMLASSCAALSIHCMGTAGESVVWLGGRNSSLKELVLARLKAGSFAVNPDSPRYRGESRANLVNLPCRQGVQLELSRELMDELFAGKSFFASGRKPRTTLRLKQLSAALQAAISDYYRTEHSVCACKGA